MGVAGRLCRETKNARVGLSKEGPGPQGAGCWTVLLTLMLTTVKKRRTLRLTGNFVKCCTAIRPPLVIM